jgi:hypothetical protein
MMRVIANSEARVAPRPLVASAAAELGIVLALSVLFPVLIHIIPVPEDARLGPRLLPIFYAPLLATLLGRMSSAWLVALLAPWLNWLLTRHPSPPTATLLMLQLLVFVGVLRALLVRRGARWPWPVPAYLAGLAAAALVAALFPALIGGRPALGWMAQSLVLGWPGLLVLALLSALTLRAYPPGGSGGPLSPAT